MARNHPAPALTGCLLKSALSRVQPRCFEVHLDPERLAAYDSRQANTCRGVSLIDGEVFVRHGRELRPVTVDHVGLDLREERRCIADVADRKGGVGAEPAVIRAVVLPDEELALEARRDDRI